MMLEEFPELLPVDLPDQDEVSTTICKMAAGSETTGNQLASVGQGDDADADEGILELQPFLSGSR